MKPLGGALKASYGHDEDLPPIIVCALGEIGGPDAIRVLEDVLRQRGDDEFFFFAHRDALSALAEHGATALVESVAADPSRPEHLRTEAQALVRRVGG